MWRRDRCSIFGMPELNAIGITVADLRRSMQFYRLLGLDLPEDPAEDHVEATMANGTRLMFDPEEVVRSFLPDWARTNGNHTRWPTRTWASSSFLRGIHCPPRWRTSTCPR